MTAISKHLPAEERRNLTVETVIELAAEQNPSDITTAAIARRMGLTQGALFRHFPSKDAIFQAVMAWVSERLLTRVEAAAAGAASPTDALEAVFMAHVEFVARHPGVPRMLFGELQRAGESAPKLLVRTLLRRYGERLRQIIDAGKEEGTLDKTVETEAAVLLFIGSIQGLVMQSLLAGRIENLRRDAHRVFALYRRAIGSKP